MEPALEECTDAISAAAGRTDVEFLLGSSLTSDIPECDLLFIDSRHTADQLWQELTLHCDEVRRWIGLHDTETFGATGEDGGPGLLAALERFLRRHPEWAPVFHSTRNHGFTVLGRNRASPPPLATSDPIPDCLLRELAGFPRPCPPVYSGPSRIDCYLTTYEQLTWPRAMASQCERLGLNPILLDNGSTYEPLLKWLETCPYPVIRVGNNAGCYGFWRARRHHFLTSPYIVSDSDLDLSGVPIDVVDRLRRALDENPDVAKAGLSLEIDDIPEHYAFKHDVVGWERQYWQVHRGEHWQAGSPPRSRYTIPSGTRCLTPISTQRCGSIGRTRRAICPGT